MKKCMDRRSFLASALALFVSAVAVSAGNGPKREPPEKKPRVEKTSRKRADHWRELAG